MLSQGGVTEERLFLYSLRLMLWGVRMKVDKRQICKRKGKVSFMWISGRSQKSATAESRRTGGLYTTSRTRGAEGKPVKNTGACEEQLEAGWLPDHVWVGEGFSSAVVRVHLPCWKEEILSQGSRVMTPGFWEVLLSGS